MTLYLEDNSLEILDRVNSILSKANTVYDKLSRCHILRLGCGFDIETSKIVTKNVTTAFCYHWQFGLEELVISGRSLNSMLKLFRHIDNFLKNMENKPKLLIWDANLGYEYQFCKTYWSAIGMSHLFAKEKRNPLRFIIGECLIMRECLGLFGHNLAQLAKNYCKTQKLKGDLDFNKVRLSGTPLTSKELKYTENDVIILVELGHYVFENFYDKGIQLPMTSTGLIRNKIKEKIGQRMRFIKSDVQRSLPNEQDYNMFRQYLFKGGICGTNSLFVDVVNYNVVCADLKSDYPAQMLHRDFPMGKCRICNNNEFKKAYEESIGMYRCRTPFIILMEFFDVKSRSSHSLMSTHKCLNKKDFNGVNSTIDNGRVFSADRVVLLLNDVEFKSFIRAYTFDPSSRIIKTWKFDYYGRLPYYVIDVLKDEYLEKQKLSVLKEKDEKLVDPREYMDRKAFVNGIFGMMCTAIFTDDWIIDGTEIVENYDKETGLIIKKSFESATKSMFLSPFWGYWITSYARMILMDVITKFPRIIIQYDTDSIYFLDGHPESEELKKYIVDYNSEIYKINDTIFEGNEHFRDLGSWIIEKPFKRFKGLGSKRYMYETLDGKIKCVVSGCRKREDGKSTIQWMYEDYCKEHHIENGDIFNFFKNGMYIDKEHTLKLTSKYVDEVVVINYSDYLGNVETIFCPSSIVLEPTDFTMGMTDEHYEFAMTMQSMYNNTLDEEFRNLWKRLGI